MGYRLRTLLQQSTFVLKLVLVGSLVSIAAWKLSGGQVHTPVWYGLAISGIPIVALDYWLSLQIRFDREGADWIAKMKQRVSQRRVRDEKAGSKKSAK